MSQTEKQSWTWERTKDWIKRIKGWIKWRSTVQKAECFLTGALDEEQALSRVCIVSAIQIIGVFLTIVLVTKGPRWAGRIYDFRIWRWGADEAWQRDCLDIALILLVTGFGVAATFYYGWRQSVRRTFSERIIFLSEGIILLTFVVNIIAFSLAMVRTGGPAHSFFAQLVPMQLSGILILEEQKEMKSNVSKKSSTRKRALYYAVFTVFVWLVVFWFQNQFATRFGWNGTTIESKVMTSDTVKRFENLAAALLFMLGMFVTAVAYWYTPRLAIQLEKQKGQKKKRRRNT